MTNDGTQDPVPPPVLADPLSGLVTGGRYEPEPVTVRVVEPPMPDITAVREAMVGMLDDDSELDLALVSHVTGRGPGPRIPTQATPADGTGTGDPATQSAAGPGQDAAAQAASGQAAGQGAAAPAADGSGQGAAAGSGEASGPADAAGSSPAASGDAGSGPASADPAPTPPIGIPAQQKPEAAKVVTPGTVENPRRLPLNWPRMRRDQAPPRPASAVGRKSSAPSVAAIILLLLVIGVIAIVLIASLIDTFASILG